MVKRVSPCCSLVSHETVKHNPVGGPSVIYSVGGPPDCSLISHETVKHNPVGGPSVIYSVGGPSD